MKPKRKPLETLTSAEIDAIMAEAEPHTLAGARFRALTALLVASGLRIGEAVRLRTDSLTDCGEGVLMVRVGSEAGCKTGYRDVPILEQDIQPHLGEWLNLRWESEYLFSTNRGTFVHPNAYNRALRHYAECAGITKRVHAHMLRHTYATNKVREGWEPSAVQQALGHRDPRMTMHYVNADTARLEELVRGGGA